MLRAAHRGVLDVCKKIACHAFRASAFLICLKGTPRGSA
jgi:hypothetical protein